MSSRSGDPIRNYIFGGGDFPVEELIPVDGPTGSRVKLELVRTDGEFKQKAKSNAEVPPEEVARFHKLGKAVTQLSNARSGIDLSEPGLRAQVPSEPHVDTNRTSVHNLSSSS